MRSPGVATPGLALPSANRAVTRRPSSLNSDQALGELEGHAVRGRLLAEDPVERPPFDQQQLLRVAAEAPPYD